MAEAAVRGRRSVAAAADFSVRVGAARYYAGFVAGMRQPALAFHLELSGACPPARWQRFNALMRAIAGDLPDAGAAVDGATPMAVAERILAFTLQIMEAAGLPVFGHVPVRVAVRQQKTVHVLTLPAMEKTPPVPRLALEWVVKLLNRHTALPEPDRAELNRAELNRAELNRAQPGKAELNRAQPDKAELNNKAQLDKLQAEYARLLKNLRMCAPGGINTLRFLQAADQAAIPWRKVAGNVFQFGWGSRARWLDSSLTQEACSMAVKLARDKAATVSVLRQAGLPVPAHQAVNSAEAAVAAANALGFPVVVKAANLDGGRGVYVGLKSEAAVRKAYADVLKLTRRVLVEAYVAGNDYRLQVYKDEVFWVTHRRPAGVTGDGVSSIRALIDTVNRERKAALVSKNSLLQPILIDDEVNAWIGEQGYSMDSVPPAGVFVRMRGAANISKGGTLEPVLERAHPDNIALAIRAARILRLDLAGVDLLIPDIAESWVKTGAAICEVNAQPQFSPHIPAWLLSRWFPDGGRIPVIATMGDPAGADWYASLRDRLRTQGVNFAVARAGSLELAAEVLPMAARDLCSSVQALLGDPAVDMLMIVVADRKDLRDGLPVDRLDALILHGQGAEPEPGLFDDLALQLAGISKQTLMLAGADCVGKVPEAKTRRVTETHLIECMEGMLKR